MCGSSAIFKKKDFDALLDQSVQVALQEGLLKPKNREAVIDGTGFSSSFASRYYAWVRRKNMGETAKTGGKIKAWLKSTVLIDRKSHWVLSTLQRRGAGGEIKDAPLLLERSKFVEFVGFLGDTAYDSEPFHALCHEHYGMKWTAIRIRAPGKHLKIPTTLYRRQMRLHFPEQKYRQRGQIECLFFRVKRRFSDTLLSRTELTQSGEAALRFLSANILFLYTRLSFQQG